MKTGVRPAGEPRPAPARSPSSLRPRAGLLTGWLILASVGGGAPSAFAADEEAATEASERAGDAEAEPTDDPERALGGVATVVTIPDDNAALKAVAAGALEAVSAKWGVLVPPIRPDATEPCQGDNLCLINLAKDRGASHLFLVGVAALGEGEVVVSLQLFDSTTGTEVMSFTDVVNPGPQPRETGRSLAEPLVAEATGVPGPDEVAAQWPPPPAPEVETYRGLSLLSIAGWTTTGAGAAVAALGFLIGASLTVVPTGLPLGVRDGSAWVFGVGALGLLATGLVLVATDLLLR